MEDSSKARMRGEMIVGVLESFRQHFQHVLDEYILTLFDEAADDFQKVDPDPVKISKVLERLNTEWQEVCHSPNRIAEAEADECFLINATFSDLLKLAKDVNSKEVDDAVFERDLHRCIDHVQTLRQLRHH